MEQAEPLSIDPTSYLKTCNEPWVKYNFYRQILEQDKHHPELYQKMLNHPKITKLIQECQTWPGEPLKRHNDATHLIHKLELLADMGLTIETPEIKEITEKIMENKDEHGFYKSKIVVPKVWGGYDDPSMAWMLCDAPVLLYVLKSFGVMNADIEESERQLIWICENNGWRCKSSLEKFKGPGRKSDFCPYSNLVVLKALSSSPKYHGSENIENALDAQFEHWDNRRGPKIRMFGIGTTFKRLKYPNVWYDILHVMDVLSRYDYSREHPAFMEMWEYIREKQNKDGSFIPESVYKAWKDWSFGQKKVASPMLTLRVALINNKL